MSLLNDDRMKLLKQTKTYYKNRNKTRGLQKYINHLINKQNDERN